MFEENTQNGGNWYKAPGTVDHIFDGGTTEETEKEKKTFNGKFIWSTKVWWGGKNGGGGEGDGV